MTDKNALPTVKAPEPSPQVPEPLPAPTDRTAPHMSAGTAADIETYGEAVDPFTGQTVTKVVKNSPSA